MKGVERERERERERDKEREGEKPRKSESDREREGYEIDINKMPRAVFCQPTLAHSFHLSLFWSSSHGCVATQHTDVNRSAERVQTNDPRFCPKSAR